MFKEMQAYFGKGENQYLLGKRSTSTACTKSGVI